MSGALLVVPPFLKSLAGPPAGPCQLAGAGRTCGVPVRVLDLNAAWLRSFPVARGKSGITGDHAKPPGGFFAAEAAWSAVSISALGGMPESLLEADHGRAEAAALLVADGAPGRAWAAMLGGARPQFVGVSLLWSGQVIAALAMSILARRRWPEVPVIWGGAHVTALAPEIAGDARYGKFVDGFVAGYAEATFREMLRGDPLRTPGVFAAGCGQPTRAGDDGTTLPAFGGLRAYGVPRLTLPVQTGRGCAYGRCAFCTYPAIEGSYRDLGLGPLEHVVRQAIRHCAEVSVKDALVPSARLDEISRTVAGRVRWSACTRLVPRLGRSRLRQLVDGGLRTLELGVESLDPATLRELDKRQPPALVEAWLADAEGLDLWLVLNMMSGFPDQRPEEAAWEARELRRAIQRHPETRVHVEHNTLEIERRSVLAARPGAFGLTLGAPGPWSSIVPWRTTINTSKEVA